MTDVGTIGSAVANVSAYHHAFAHTNATWNIFKEESYAEPIPPPPSRYNIKPVHSGKCLDVVVASQDNGANVQQWDCGSTGNPNQKWELVPDGPNYQIKAVHSGKCLDVAVASQANGGNVHQYDCHGGPNQAWEITTEDGTAFVLE